MLVTRARIIATRWMLLDLCSVLNMELTQSTTDRLNICGGM